jgi:hypothetical protein
VTTDEINRAIGELYGWQADYCGDLNAMHEAEQMLTEDQFKMYTHWLEKLMPNTEYRSLLCAPSSRRAEAFLRAMGKWEEVQP